MHVLWECVFCALVVIRNVGTSGELTNTQGHLLHADERNFTKHDSMKQEAFEQLQALPGSTFNLRVQVNDMLSRQPLSRAALDLFVNHRLNSTALSEEDGSVRLRVPFHSGLPITVVASKKGFISALLLCKTSKIPIFSSIIVPLLRLNQGNIWLFEDTVLITGRTAAAVSQPTVRFPQSLLNLTHSRNISSIRAYLTVPKLTSQQDSSLNTLGIISSQSGYISVELSPVAAVCVQLFSGDTELQVKGPIQISLNVPDSCGLQAADVVPAWFFNRTIGGWMRKGLGMMNLVEGKLMWTFAAPHLGYWIAAPLSPNRGIFGFPALLDFISQHSFFLTVLVGGTLFAFILFLLGLLCFCRRKIFKNKTRKASTVMRKDQTTSTVHDEESEASSALQHADGENQRSNRCLDSFLAMKSGEVIANLGAAAVPSECNTLDVINMTSEQTPVPSCHPNGLFFYNQPLAILPAPAFFHLEEHPEQADWSRSATLPRVGASNGAAAEPQRKESFTQTFHTEDQLQSSEGSPGPSNTSRMPFNLPESASVPGTLNKLAGSRHSVHAITGLSKIPSPQPPRAWFVSLEGKPAAEIRYAVSEQQRRRRPMESRETSLDSGVDLSELNQSTGRRPVTLERNATFIKSPSNNKNAPQE
ncbi:PREDICTED: protein FAM171B-like [Cyprinodon variegatus]|uniref:protein FAM171B-like n=1 Tax=Cyprinodon variegatus TaxID=28743 RepID=UPI00074290F6|nr:PREDICTED: protein FAM171B-like [Cyprinodon variegatus]